MRCLASSGGGTPMRGGATKARAWRTFLWWSRALLVGLPVLLAAPSTGVTRAGRSTAATRAATTKEAAAAPAVPGRFPDIAAGREVILQRGCANCHGILGPGGREGPDLLRAARAKGAPELLAAMWNHIPQMVQSLLTGERLPSLSAGELRNLVGYLIFVNYLGDPGDPERGGVQVAQMPCLACHDLMQRGRIGPALVRAGRGASPVGLVTDIWNHYPVMRAALRDRGLPWFEWNGELVTDVSSYLRSLALAPAHNPLLTPGDPTEGRRLFVGLGCASCHGPAQGRRWIALARQAGRRSAAENGAVLLTHLPMIEQEARRVGTALRPLPEKGMADLLAYLGLADTELPGGDASRGRAVFEHKRCHDCHALPGEKPGIGPDVAAMPASTDPYEAAALMLQHARNMKVATELKHIPWPRVEAGELLDLYAFLSLVERP